MAQLISNLTRQPWIATTFTRLLLFLMHTSVIQQVVGELELCPGESLTLICHTNHTFVEWSVITSNQPSLNQSRTVSSSALSPVVLLPIRVNTTNIIFSRDSPRNVLPLVSTMAIDVVSSHLNGSTIICTGINSSSVSSVVLVKTIRIFDLDRDVPNSPEITTSSDIIHFGNDNFTVILEWLQFSGETYTVATTPEAVHTRFTANTNVQLVMLYNTQYNVTVNVALCGYRNATNFTKIYYSTCDYPIPGDDVAMILNTEGPFIEGSAIIYSCSAGLTVTGPNTSICMDRQWEPNPLDIKCIAICGQAPLPNNGYIYPYSNTSLMLIVICHERAHIVDCNLNGTWQPNPTDLCDSDDESQSNPDIKHTIGISTMAILIVSSVLSSFIFGIICGQITRLFHCKRTKQSLRSKNSPDYEGVPISARSIANSQKTCNLQLNEAYGELYVPKK